ncbi:Hermansky-Pudlak syndrome 4 protein isoform X1 [Hyaena hyaena]|uniref:Hermansky-Pudlak syndrome 4 protein isoform X1 n=1 Tax=Hyaena hyaena TaxID=95912 RepID=UPI00192068D9|nr:Hermansky-Pudlak syndrome 4 protein isoform X1 [Hyaena hyaena]XP_039081234.1 Hermansky-Pudlak syndrome 4 protein isoform X1 [Hyaena hyaena]XP_039081238.1 Hermansky-Pudlak syndrome 4 protein isoform X1 [Hyaena hyaena]
MATSTSTEPTSASWWNYFFLYDGSKVKEEGDPTRAGICYFYPSQTLLDQQELLCGQIAGVVRCVSDISTSATTLIRLRKLKFAIRVDGEYLWVLGCAAELPDISCRHFLDQIIGVFHFYNGPVSLAYQHCPREALHAAWDTFIAQILRNTSDLHKIFNSLWNLDRTKVEPLLLLKAALILQTCQRSPHILAGCILHKGLIVSTQLPPSLTAKVLIRPAAPRDQSPPAGEGDPGARGAAFPPNVQIRPVFLTEEEAVGLHEFPTEEAASSAALPAGPQEYSGQHPPRRWSTSAPTENATSRLESAAWTLATTPEPTGPDAAQPDGKGESRHLPGCALGHIKPVTQQSPARAWGPGVHRSPARKPRPPWEEEEQDLSEIHIPEARDAGWCPNSFALPSTCILDGGSPCSEECASDSGLLEPKPPGALPAGTGLGSLSSLSTPDALPRHGALEPHSHHPGRSSPAPPPREDRLPGRTSRLRSWPCVDLRRSGATLPGAEHRVEQRAGAHHSLSVPGSSDPAGSQDSGPSTDTGDPRPDLTSRQGLVPMTLYTHSVNGLVLLLLAEEPLLGDHAAVEEVYHSSLASLNGLEVHLKETLPKDTAAFPSRTYNFTHYDRIQHVLTMNVPQVAATQDRRFLRAVSLMHSDFARLPALYEMTVRNASTAVYACCSPVQETYFQQLAAAARSSGFPSPQDGAFSLPGKAKQKLLKHGVNLL